MSIFIDAAQGERVRQLPAEGLTVEEISERTGNSGAPLRLVQPGKRRPYEEVQLEDDPFQQLIQPRRCPGCGGKVYDIPCRLCHLRAELAKSTKRKTAATVEGGSR